MSEVVVTRGLPGSGKSTWAKAWVAGDPENRVRVNRDDIRYASFGKYWGVDEDYVSAVELAAVKAAIKAGKDVVIDATHLRAAYIKKWARVHPVTVQAFEVPVDVAVARDAARDRTVGEKGIRDMATRFLNKDGSFKPLDLSDVQPAEGFTPAPEYNYLLPDAILVDTDGTGADEGVAIRVERGGQVPLLFKYKNDSHYVYETAVLDSGEEDIESAES